MVEGTISDPSDEYSDLIAFGLQIKDEDVVFIDIDRIDGHDVIKISKCNSFTSDIISSIIYTNK
jgi:hypothetical protein